MATLSLRNLPELPANSAIQVEETPEGLELRWLNPRGDSASKRAMMAFLLFWLTGWVAGGTLVIWRLVQGLKAGDGLDRFLVVWLLGWLVGLVLAGRGLLSLLRRSRPELLTLTSAGFYHRQGTPPFASPGRRDNWPFSLRKQQPVSTEDDWSQVRSFHLDWTDDRQHLVIEVYSQTVEVARYLREPEREWVFEVLRACLGCEEGEVPAPAAPEPGGPRELPAETGLAVAETFEGTEVRWQNPRGMVLRTAFALLGCVPAVLFGFFAVLLARGLYDEVRKANSEAYMLLVLIAPCLAVCAYFGSYTLRALWSRAPEVLTLGPDTLVYQYGTRPVREANELEPWEAPQSSFGLFERRKRMALRRDQLSGVRLVSLRTRTRLTVDEGAERIQIGRYLRDSDREWLADVLRLWLAQG